MKCVAIKEAKKLEVTEIDEPVSNETDVIIEIKKAGICGSDIHYYEMGNPVGLVMGHEFCGSVIDAGDRNDLQVGDRVTALPISPCGKCEACLKGNPQYCSATWDEAVGLSLKRPGAFSPKISVRSDMVLKVPDNVTDEEAAMVEPTAVGLHSVNLADMHVGDKVLVIGGGIIGLVSAMFAKKAGARLVVVSETNPSRGQKSVDLGVADAWLNAKEENFLANASKISNGGFDKVIECCGNAPAVSSAIMAVKGGGTIVLAGVSMSPISIPTVAAVMHEVTMKGSIAYTKEEFQTVIDLMSTKQIDVKKFMSKIVSLEEVDASFAELYSGTTDSIKILVDPKK